MGAAAVVERPDGNGSVSSDDLLAFAFRFGRGPRVPLVVYRFMNLFRTTFVPEEAAEAMGVLPPPISRRLDLRIDRSCASLARMGSSISSEDDDEEDEGDDNDDDDDAAENLGFLVLEPAI